MRGLGAKAVVARSHYDAALDALASEDDALRNKVEEWHLAAKATGGYVSLQPGGAARPAGAYVSENLNHEAHLPEQEFTRLLQALAQGGASGPGDALARHYSKTCQALVLTGGDADRPPDAVLFRLITPSRLDRIKDEFGGFGLSHREWWRAFSGWTTPKVRQLLSEIFLSGPREELPRHCFAAVFVRGSRSIQVENDGDLIRLHDRLGLDWAIVASWRTGGRRIPPEGYLLRYSPGEVQVASIPTVADAGWYPYFLPPAPDAKIGTTRDRRDPDAPGYPEIVHRNRDMSCVVDEPEFWEVRIG